MPEIVRVHNLVGRNTQQKSVKTAPRTNTRRLGREILNEFCQANKWKLCFKR